MRERAGLAAEDPRVRELVLARAGDDDAGAELVGQVEDLLPGSLVPGADLARHVDAQRVECLGRGARGPHGRLASGVAQVLMRVVQRVQG